MGCKSRLKEFSHHIIISIDTGKASITVNTNKLFWGSVHFFLYNRLLSHALPFHVYLSSFRIVFYSVISFIVCFPLWEVAYITVSWNIELLMKCFVYWNSRITNLIKSLLCQRFEIKDGATKMMLPHNVHPPLSGGEGGRGGGLTSNQIFKRGA